MIIAGFDKPPTPKQIETWAADLDYTVLQTWAPMPDYVWPLLNETFFSRRPDVRLRVYGFPGAVCDLSFVSKMTNVTDFAADCLMDAKGLHHLSEMTWLKRLSVGVFNAESFDFISELPIGLEFLVLSNTRSKKPRIDGIARLTNLKTLYLSGQQKGIEAIAALHQLEKLSLASVTVDSLSFLHGLDRLWTLTIVLGGTRNLDALRRMTGIKNLELIQIQKFDDLSPISDITGLQRLFLENLPHVHQLPDLSKLQQLRRIAIDKLKGLESVSDAATAPFLEEFACIGTPMLHIQEYQPLLRHPTLRKMLVAKPSGGSRSDLLQAMKAANIETMSYLYEPFEFR